MIFPMHLDESEKRLPLQGLWGLIDPGRHLGNRAHISNAAASCDILDTVDSTRKDVANTTLFNDSDNKNVLRVIIW